MRYHHEFEWDPQKAKTNRTKHGVTFEDAKAVLEDEQAELYHVETYDDAHSMAEDRHITTGSHPADRIIMLLICWTDRYQEDQRSRGSSAHAMQTAGKGRDMLKRSKAGKTIRVSAGTDPATMSRELARLRKTMRRPVQTDEIPELKGTEPRVCRDASGNLPIRRVGPVRRAILESLDDQGMTRYELWKKARAHCGTLSRSAVYEYLRGARDIGVEYAEALMMAAGLTLVGRGEPESKK